MASRRPVAASEEAKALLASLRARSFAEVEIWMFEAPSQKPGHPAFGARVDGVSVELSEAEYETAKSEGAKVLDRKARSFATSRKRGG